MSRRQHVGRRVMMVVACLALGIPLLAGAQAAPATSTDVAASSGSTASFRFADVPWGSTFDVLKTTLENQDYTFDKVDEDGDYWFTGKVLGYEADVVAFMTPKRQVSKIAVMLITPDNKARDTYALMLDMLTKKYGEPTANIARYDDPYYEGDGFEDQAIRIGKGHFIAMWGPMKKAAEHLTVEISDRLTVVVSYESAGWTNELARRRAVQTNVF